MFENKKRIKTYLETIIKETELVAEMSKDINTPNDFLTSLNGMTIFRACGMSIQFITETLVKIRNLAGMDFFNSYKVIPWNELFGMRNFISHEYSDVNENFIFSTVKKDMPTLMTITQTMLDDLNSGKLDEYIQ
ncbi:MAG: DUF86 domain-containing protein [Bacteroidaceae bacterium]|nr:DUF86 domain-containing protein [Bacteroidaceae bacterium]